MASSKEPSTSRPVSGSFPRHPATSRQHSHSISLAPTNPSHRVNRRKSVNASASSTAAAAVAAALREHGDASMIPLASHRRSLGSRKGTESQSMSTRPSMHAYFSGNGQQAAGAAEVDQELASDVLDDGSPDDEAPEHKNSTKNRNRRASEGSHLIKGGKRVTSEVRCDTCGKGYKHSSCLTKHMWEHDPAWALTSKLLISKHQQVQLLEAAKVLYTMTSDEPGQEQNQEQMHVDLSESSGSPRFSGSSDHHDEISSVETTPPPMSEAAYPVPDAKRYSASSAGFSRSYRSIPSSSFAESIVSPGLPPYRLSGVDLRPSTSGTDDGGLAAAAELLNFGTPRTKATQLGSDVPPVPPLPQQYQSYNKLSGSIATPTVYNPLSMHPPTLTQQLSDERAFRVDEDSMRKSSLSRNHADTHMDDEEMFKMEE